MKIQNLLTLAASSILLAGCMTPTDGSDWWDKSIGKKGDLWPYRVQVEASDPGVKIEMNDDLVATLEGKTGEVIVWGYKDGRLRERQTVRLVAHPVVREP